eukprot:30965-Pelagococcus_subviridis.AAC.7
MTDAGASPPGDNAVKGGSAAMAEVRRLSIPARRALRARIAPRREIYHSTPCRKRARKKNKIVSLTTAPLVSSPPSLPFPSRRYTSRTTAWGRRSGSGASARSRWRSTCSPGTRSR